MWEVRNHSTGQTAAFVAKVQRIEAVWEERNWKERKGKERKGKESKRILGCTTYCLILSCVSFTSETALICVVSVDCLQASVAGVIAYEKDCMKRRELLAECFNMMDGRCICNSESFLFLDVSSVRGYASLCMLLQLWNCQNLLSTTNSHTIYH